MAKHKDGLEDILFDRRLTSDFLWVTKAVDMPKYKHYIHRTPAQTKIQIMKSDRIRHCIEKIVQETNKSQEQVEAEVKKILDEMSQQLQLKAIRFFGFALTKIWKKIYRNIYVNNEGIERARLLVKDFPVILMPSHRSYVDFLLLSFICFHYNMPLPIIAAGLDFLSMKMISNLLRHSGAFFIRRSFGTDKLYWSVFTEYVQTHVCNADAPIEFFVEGTRSRTAKSLTPKLGFLTAVLEPYFKAQVADIMIIPISISYERTLEENLYAYELLGIPKPKESTSGLIKARNILSNDYGYIHVYFGEPISLRKYCNNKLDRGIHGKEPRYLSPLTNEEQVLINQMAYQVVLSQQKHMTLSCWSLVAAILLQYYSQGLQRIPLENLVEDFRWLKQFAESLGAYVDWQGYTHTESIIRSSLALHQNVTRITSDNIVEILRVNVAQAPNSTNVAHLSFEAVSLGATQLLLGHYRNQICHVFVRAGLITLAVSSAEKVTKDLLSQYYHFLEKLLSQEFIFLPGKTEQDLSQTLFILTHLQIVQTKDNVITASPSKDKYIKFLNSLFIPFLEGYWVMCQYMLSLQHSVTALSSKDLSKQAQLLGEILLAQGIISHYEILSLDLLGNCLNSLINIGAVRKLKSNGSIEYLLKKLELESVASKIDEFLKLPTREDQLSKVEIHAKL